jgi:hypothetical protein
MNTTITLTLSIAGAALGLLGLIAAVHALREARRWRARCVTVQAGLSAVESSLGAIRREFELAVSISMKSGRRANRIEQEFSEVADRLDQVELRGTAPAFEQAIDSARLGVNPVKLAQRFGLSPIEADLVTRLHGRKANGRSETN